ncbi:MAG: DNA polymerase III subunit delta' [Casimicrobiaceae bacterium]
MIASARGSTPLRPELLPWQVEPARVALAARATWPHAMLLDGPQGIGKRTLALYFARALLCEAPRAGAACGQCPSCHYISAGAHPDLRMVEPIEIDEEGVAKRLDEIAVKAIRALIEWTQITSHRGMAKVAVIVPAEAMNPAAANALLKTLEEPPAATYLLLVAHQAGRIPPTLRSRCRRVPIGVPDPDIALAWLAKQDVTDAATVLAQAGGAPLCALEIASQDSQQERSAWLQALAWPQSLSPISLAARIEAAPRGERSARLRDVIDWLLAWTADLGRVAAGGEPLRNVDFHRVLAALAPKVAPIPLFRYHRTLLEQRTLTAHPLQPRLVVEALLIGYCELFA